MEEIRIQSLVHGGQGIGTLESGKKVFVWGVLPDETVRVEVKKSKKSYAEADVLEILEPSPHRVDARDGSYLATSPWQVLDFAYEQEQKRRIVTDSFEREGISLPEFEAVTDGKEYGYRNKMEYSFYGDDEGLHLALYNRGTHQKQIVTGSSLARPELDEAANAIAAELSKLAIRAGDLKSVIVRCSQDGSVAAALFTRRTDFPKLTLPKELKGLKVVHSNPKSPASVYTKLLYELGSTELYDSLLGIRLTYDAVGFFQVNLPVFEVALRTISTHTKGNDRVIDMYSGVGSIGIPLRAKTLVELDPANVQMAKKNIQGEDIEVIHASAETSLQYISPDATVIVDPPRAGLHERVVDTLIAEQPPKIVYLSCNPSTQARDIARLSAVYTVDFAQMYNFFPHTPHIEMLVVLSKKSVG